jgi:hypothetical protein
MGSSEANGRPGSLVCRPNPGVRYSWHAYCQGPVRAIVSTPVTSALRWPPARQELVKTVMLQDCGEGMPAIVLLAAVSAWPVGDAANELVAGKPSGNW